MSGLGHQDAHGSGGTFSKGVYRINRKQNLRGQGPVPILIAWFMQMPGKNRAMRRA